MAPPSTSAVRSAAPSTVSGPCVCAPAQPAAPRWARRDLTGNYFRQVYATPLGRATPVTAEEHSGQVDGQERREIEIRFRDPEDPLNVLVCTPTMELGIDIGHLNAVTLRNVPLQPSNYAQQAWGGQGAAVIPR